MIEAFFNQLSRRFTQENDLSDITWSLAEACPLFKHFFLEFIFDKPFENSVITLFKREHTSGDCRPDFCIHSDGQEHIIECKIESRRHRIADYRAEFPNAQFGYITNYPLSIPEEKITIRNWAAFKNFLNTRLAQVEDAEVRSLISGYLTYLSNVCRITEISKMNLENLLSLRHFNNMVTKLISGIDGYESAPYYRATKSFSHNRSGQYFSLQKGDSQIIYPWLGVYYTDYVCICLAFDEMSCKLMYDAPVVDRLSGGGKNFDPPYKDAQYDHSLYFELSKQKFNEFNDSNTPVEKQEEIVRSFLKEVLTCVDDFWV